MSVEKLIDQVLSSKNLTKFQTFIERYQNDINQYVLIDTDSDTQMNILHIMSARSNNHLLTADILYDFICTLSTMNGFNVNYYASVEHIFNMTAAHIAVQWRNVPMLQALIKFGCDLLICDCNGQNVQDYAEILKDNVIIKLVKEGIYLSIENRHRTHLQIDHFNNDLNFYEERNDNEFNNEYFLLSNSLDSITSSTSGFAKSPPLNTLSGYSQSPSLPSQEIYTDNENSFSFESFNSMINHIRAVSKEVTTNDIISDNQVAKNIHDKDNNEKDTISNKNCNNISLESEKITEIVYKDDQLELIEERFQPVSSPIPITENIDILNNSSSSSVRSSHNDSKESIESIDDLILKMNDTQLYHELDKIGFSPGPVNDGTRKYYQQKFQLLSKKEKNDIYENKSYGDNNEIIAKMANYKIEFDSIRSRTFPFKEAIEYENLLIKQFQHDIKDEKQIYFVYLLLDPTITENLPSHINSLIDCSKTSALFFTEMFGNILNDYTLFYRFIASVFYVGKGQSNRPYQHLVDAYKERKLFNKEKLDKSISAKTKRIWSIWDQGHGPISLNFFSGITADEAFTREALIIETISLFNLTNKISGTYRCQLKLNQRQKSVLGTYLLFKFFIIYLLNGERQIKIPA